MSTMSIVNIQKSLKPMTMMARLERPIAMASVEFFKDTIAEIDKQGKIQSFWLRPEFK